MNLLPTSASILHAAEITTTLPLLGALLIVSLPVLLPLLAYRWVHGPATPDAG